MDPVFTVPTQAKANLRRSLILATAVGVAAIAVLTPFGHLPLALFGFLGLALGALNSLLVQRSVLRFAAVGKLDRIQMARSSLSRLGLITGIAVLIGLLVRPSGLGVFAGLAVFQLLMILISSVPALKELRQS